VNELKPCPFCGSEPEAATYTVNCINPFCEVQPEAAGQSQAEAIAGWNRRAEVSNGGAAIAEALTDLLRIHDWVALAGGSDGPLPRDVIQKFAEQQLPAIDAARAALEAWSPPSTPKQGEGE
jgi:hypothetical protein